MYLSESVHSHTVDILENYLLCMYVCMYMHESM